MSLRIKLTALFGTIAGCVMVFGALAVSYQREAMESAALAEAQELAQIMAHSLALTSINGRWRTYQKSKLQDFALSLKKQQNLDVVVVDAHKNVLADPVRQNVGKLFFRDETNEVGQTLRDGIPRTFLEIDATGGVVRKIVVPLKKENQKIGAAIILDYTKFCQDYLGVFRVHKVLFGLMGLASLLLAVACSYLGSRWIANPIRKVKEAADNLAQGMVAAKVTLKSKDELGQLAEAVNRMGKQLKDSQERLLAYDRELEQSNREIRLLSQMGELLQSCRMGEAAYAIIAQSLGQLFPEDSGALYVFASSRLLLERVGVWGEAPPPEPEIAPTDCWGMRRGELFSGGDGYHQPRCRHVQNGQRPYFCVPIGPPSEELGLLQVAAGPPSPQEEAAWLPGRQRLAQGVAEHLSLALANLKTNEELRNQSLRDPLTGMFNRRYMEESLEREVFRAARQGTPLGIIMLDLDHFKRFNDSFGHVAGDVLLRELGLMLRKHIRSSDIPCRYGGEEFTLILPDASLEVVRKRAEELRAAGRRLKVWHVYRWLGVVTLSMGVAMFPDHGTTAKAILQAADSALYRAKQTGRDRVCVAGENGDQALYVPRPPIAEERRLGH